MIKTLLYKCSLCRKEASFDNIRYSDDGKRIVCLECYTKKNSQQPPKYAENAEISQKDEAHINLICKDCRYKFRIKKKQNTIIKCPYCSSKSLMRDEFDINKVIEEVSAYKE